MFCSVLIPISAVRIADATSTAHLDKVERGYENMDHFHVRFKKVGQVLRSIDFIQGEGSTESNVSAPTPQICCHFDVSFHFPSTEEEDEEDEDEEGEAEDDEAARTGSQVSAVTPASLQPSEPQQLNPLTVTSATSS